MRALPTHARIVTAATALTLAAAAAVATGAQAQTQATPAAPNGVTVSAADHHDISAPLRSLQGAPTTTRVHPVRHAGGPAAASQSPVTGSPDTSGVNVTAAPRIPATTHDFAGIGNRDGVLPPDTQGAVGPTQYFAMVNSHIAVFSKTGATLLSPRPTSSMWAGFGGGCQNNNDGDGSVLFDGMSKRWIISQFSVSTLPYLECVAVSRTSDATGAYNRYAFRTPAQNAAGDGFPDYPKMGVWPDAYYTTFNLFNGAGSAGQGSQVCAYDRAKMLAGTAATQQCKAVIGPKAPPLDDSTVMPASVEGATPPPAGSHEYLLAIPQVLSGTQTSLFTWTFHVDFTTPANTVLSPRRTLTVSAYNEPCVNVRACVPQTGFQRLDGLGDRLMSRASYRNLGTRQSLVVDHAVVSGTSIGMRWYELRASAGVLSVAQQGTVHPDAKYRWMGSVSMDKAGDMAMGYSVSSSTMAPQIRYTGRLVGDPTGTMPQGEGTVALGATGPQLIGDRWGDYTTMTVDPVDNCTFWYSNEYGLPTGDWATRIASFKFPSCV